MTIFAESFKRQRLDSLCAEETLAPQTSSYVEMSRELVECPHLPVELIRHILSFVEGDSLPAASLVSRSWRHVVINFFEASFVFNQSLIGLRVLLQKLDQKKFHDSSMIEVDPSYNTKENRQRILENLSKKAPKYFGALLKERLPFIFDACGDPSKLIHYLNYSYSEDQDELILHVLSKGIPFAKVICTKVTNVVNAAEIGLAIYREDPTFDLQFILINLSNTIESYEEPSIWSKKYLLGEKIIKIILSQFKEVIFRQPPENKTEIALNLKRNMDGVLNLMKGKTSNLDPKGSVFIVKTLIAKFEFYLNTLDFPGPISEETNILAKNELHRKLFQIREEIEQYLKDAALWYIFLPLIDHLFQLTSELQDFSSFSVRMQQLVSQRTSIDIVEIELLSRLNLEEAEKLVLNLTDIQSISTVAKYEALKDVKIAEDFEKKLPTQKLKDIARIEIVKAKASQGNFSNAEMTAKKISAIGLKVEAYLAIAMHCPKPETYLLIARDLSCLMKRKKDVNDSLKKIITVAMEVKHFHFAMITTKFCSGDEAKFYELHRVARTLKS